MKKYLYWCNECNWEESMDEHNYDFCPKCGHINISRKTNRPSRPSKPAKSGRPTAYKPKPEPSNVIMTDEDKQKLK